MVELHDQIKAEELKAKVSPEIDLVELHDRIKAEDLKVKVTPEVDQVQLKEQIGKMQAEITNEFTGGEGGLGGEGGAGGDASADVTSITEILNGWTDIITAIRDRLPMQALAY